MQCIPRSFHPTRVMVPGPSSSAPTAASPDVAAIAAVITRFVLRICDPLFDLFC